MPGRIKKTVFINYRPQFCFDFASQFPSGAEQQSSPYPLPSGEGQPDTPINRHNQGEVMTPRIEKSVFINYFYGYCRAQDFVTGEVL